MVTYDFYISLTILCSISQDQQLVERPEGLISQSLNALCIKKPRGWILDERMEFFFENASAHLCISMQFHVHGLSEFNLDFSLWIAGTKKRFMRIFSILRMGFRLDEACFVHDHG